MSRLQMLTLTLALFVCVSTGCRNCQNQCGPLGWRCPSTLPAPATYSLNIPNGANQPYYNGVPTNNGVPTTARQTNPTLPAGNTPSLAPGWRPIEPTNPNQPTSVLQTNPTSANTVAPPLNQAPIRSASAANGLSYKDSVNYRTTNVDERFDDTRLPATDATNVRAPTSFNATSGIPVSQTAPIYQGNPVVYSAQPTLVQSAPSTFTQAQPTPMQPGTIQGTFQYATPAPYTAYPAVSNPVLAQSTTFYDPNNAPQNDAGWRDRELTTRR